MNRERALERLALTKAELQSRFGVTRLPGSARQRGMKRAQTAMWTSCSLSMWLAHRSATSRCPSLLWRGSSCILAAMQQHFHTFHIPSRGEGLYAFTGEVEHWVQGTGIRNGLLTLMVRHTSASLILQENADPDVQRDLLAFFQRLVPAGDPLYRHTLEGPDDMPAHVRSVLTQTHLSIPVQHGELLLGTWQGIYLFEHRRAGHRRQVVAHLIGEDR